MEKQKIPPRVVLSRHLSEIDAMLKEGFGIRVISQHLCQKYDYSFSESGLWRAIKKSEKN